MDVMEYVHNALDYIEDELENNAGYLDQYTGLNDMLADAVMYAAPEADDDFGISNFIVDNPEILKHKIAAATEPVGDIMSAAIRQYIYREAQDTNRWDDLVYSGV